MLIKRIQVGGLHNQWLILVELGQGMYLFSGFSFYQVGHQKSSALVAETDISEDQTTHTKEPNIAGGKGFKNCKLEEYSALNHKQTQGVSIFK